MGTCSSVPLFCPFPMGLEPVRAGPTTPRRSSEAVPSRRSLSISSAGRLASIRNSQLPNIVASKFESSFLQISVGAGGGGSF
jgi:hypothetical protein